MRVCDKIINMDQKNDFRSYGSNCLTNIAEKLARDLNVYNGEKTQSLIYFSWPIMTTKTFTMSNMLGFAFVVFNS